MLINSLLFFAAIQQRCKNGLHRGGPRYRWIHVDIRNICMHCSGWYVVAKIVKVALYTYNILTCSGGSSVLFYPEEITSEYFRETLELKQTDPEKHSEEDKDAISDIDDGYYSRK